MQSFIDICVLLICKRCNNIACSLSTELTKVLLLIQCSLGFAITDVQQEKKKKPPNLKKIAVVFHWSPHMTEEY